MSQVYNFIFPQSACHQFQIVIFLSFRTFKCNLTISSIPITVSTWIFRAFLFNAPFSPLLLGSMSIVKEAIPVLIHCFLLLRLVFYRHFERRFRSHHYIASITSNSWFSENSNSFFSILFFPISKVPLISPCPRNNMLRSIASFFFPFSFLSLSFIPLLSSIIKSPSVVYSNLSFGVFRRRISLNILHLFFSVRFWNSTSGRILNGD